MIPKMKARELRDLFRTNGITYGKAKDCALMCVDKITEALSNAAVDDVYLLSYWQEVKKEIEKL